MSATRRARSSLSFSGEPNEEDGPDYLEPFLAALEGSLPPEGCSIGSLRIHSGELLLSDVWQALDEEARVTLRVSAGDYVVERFRIDCPWDDAVNGLMGIQVAAVRRTR